MSKRAVVFFGLVCLTLPLLAACSRTSAAPAGGGRGGRGDGGGVPVVVAQVTQKDVPVDIDGIGNVEAYSTISVRAQVTGQLTDVLFREGDFVKKGDHIFSLDARPFEAMLQQAQANLVRDQALLSQSEANLTRDASNAEYSQLVSERNATLAAKGILSKDQADQSRAAADATAATVKADKAAVESARAQLAAQQAAVENAKVALSYTVIRSPIDGRTGNLAVKSGNLVTANSTELMTIAQIQPVNVTFAVPAMHLPTIKRAMTQGKLPVIATPQDADAEPANGELRFIDNAVDATTDTIKLKATFQNPDRRLWPGQFTRVKLRLATLPQATIIPQQALQTGQDGQFVFVVQPDSTVEQRPVTAGADRKELVNQIIEKLRPQVDAVAGVQTFMQNPPTIRIGGQVSKSLYQYSMQSPDKQQLYAAARALEKRLAQIPGIQDLTSDLEITSPQVNVEIDRDKAAALGVTASQIENAFYDAYGPRWVSTIYAAVNEYKVLLELAPRFQQDPSALSMLYFKGNGPVVPLDTLATARQQIGPQTVNHYGQLTSVTLSFGLKQGASLGGILTQVRDTADATLPEGVSGQFQGAAKAFEGALSNLAVLLVIAILVVYIVLGILYESYIHPLTILSGLPSAAFGALVTLLVFRMDLNIYAFVGMIMLIGIVEKNAIMQIDFALDAERGGMTPEQAIYQGCLIRFRPIMMTTMAAMLGAVPIAIGYGAGGEARQPLGLVVVGGLLFSQLVTLYLTPVVYTYLAQVQTWLKHGKAVGQPEPLPAK